MLTLTKKQTKGNLTEYCSSVFSGSFTLTHHNMVVQESLKILNRIKPRLLLAISFATYYPTNEPIWQRFLIRASYMSTILCLISTLLHIKNAFEGQLTQNIAISFIFVTGCVQVLSKSILERYHRNNVLELLDKVQSLYNFENEKLNSIAEKNLKKFRTIWIICHK